MRQVRDPGAPRGYGVKKIHVKAHTRTILTTPHDVGTTAQPKRRGHAPNVFKQPLSDTPTKRILRQQRRHTARAVAPLEHEHLPARPLTQREVDRTLGTGKQAHVHVPESLRLLDEMTPAQMKRVDFNKLAKVKGPGQTLTSAAHELARGIERSAAPPKPKGGGFSLTPAAVVSDIGAELKGSGALEKGIGKIGAADVAGWEKLPGVGHFIGNAAKDAYTIPETALPSIYLPSKAVAEGHYGKAGKMLATPFVELAKHPLKQLTEHPITTALILRGGEGALSRGAGATARSGLLGKTAREGASLERRPLRLTGDAAIEQRHASKGLIENYLQKAIDRRAIRKGRGVVLNDKTYNEHGQVVGNKYTRGIQATERQMMKPGPGRPGAGFLGRRLDQTYGGSVDATRQARDAALRVVDKHMKTKARDAVPLIAEGVIKNERTVKADLVRHLEQLQEARKDIPATHPADRARSDTNIAAVEKLLGDHKFLADPSREFAAAQLYHKVHGLYEEDRAHYGDFTRAQANRRVLLPFAVRELGLKFNHDTGRFELPTLVPAHVAQTVDRATASLKDQLDRARSYAAPSRIQQLEDQLAKTTAEAAKKAMATARTNRHGTVEIGLPVSDKYIADQLHARGGDINNLSYVPAKSDFTGSHNFYGAMHRRPGAESHRYTGAGTKAATYERSFETMRQQLANAAVKVGRHESVNNLVNTFGVKQSDGRYFDLQGATREAANQRAATGVEYVPVTVARQTAPHTLLEDLSPAELDHTFQPAAPGDAHVVLMPKPVLDRIQEHLSVNRNPITKALRPASRYFRHAVLPTSPKWFLGNAAEALLRMQINELTPAQVAATIRAGRTLEGKLRDVATEQARTKGLSEEAALRAGDKAVANLRAAAGAGHFGSQRQLDIFNPDEGDLLKLAHKVRQAGFTDNAVVGRIGPKGVGDAWDAYRNAVTGANAKLENSVYFYALGKQARLEVQAMTGSWLKSLRLAGPAYEDVARGLLESNNISRYARAVDDIRGRYSNLSPNGRAWVSTVLPFAPWYVNSLRFIYVTLPGHHPVKAALLAAASQGTEQQRKSFNLPPWAESSVPLGHGRYLAAEHYTPFGIFEGGQSGLEENAKQLFAPQISGVAANLAGQDWTGKELPQGTSRSLVALNTAAETFIPFLSRARQIRERGGVSVPGSTVLRPMTKPNAAQVAYWRERTGNPKLTPTQAARLHGASGSLLAGLNKAFNPFRPTRPSSTRRHRKSNNYGIGGTTGGSSDNYGIGGSSSKAKDFGVTH